MINFFAFFLYLIRTKLNILKKFASMNECNHMLLELSHGEKVVLKQRAEWDFFSVIGLIYKVFSVNC